MALLLSSVVPTVHDPRTGSPGHSPATALLSLIPDSKSPIIACPPQSHVPSLSKISVLDEGGGAGIR